jgi:hypothetical protein
VSVNHQKRIEGLVDQALKEVAIKEPYGYVVSMTFAPPVDGDGSPMMNKPHVPSWWLFVSIRNNLVGQPDIGNGFAINGLMPPDQVFRYVAQGLFHKCLQDKDKQQEGSLAAAQAAFAEQMKGAA